MKKRVVVGMSGGVDSSVAAYLLMRQGYDVVGLFMHNWEEEENGSCTAADDWNDVIGVCGKLGIPYYSVNFAKEYSERVFKYFLDEYRRGRTPNPDVLCNREIKFGPFARYAAGLGADYIATGHYCDICENDGAPNLLTAADTDKDQTYFLNQVKTAQLKNVLFPLGGLKKDEVRDIAAEEGLVTAEKKDSTGICFIGERKFRRFLSEYLPGQKGDIVSTEGKKVGEHAGLMFYTLGQRKGLGIGGIAGEEANRWYVVGKDMQKNRLIVSCGEGEELFSSALKASGLNIIGKWSEKKFECTAKFRYRQSEQPVFATVDGDNLTLEFARPQRAVTPGQYAVLYTDSIVSGKRRCLGGAVIDRVIQ